MVNQHQLVKIEFVKVWVTRLPPLSHPPLSMWRHRVTCLPPKNASAPWGGSVSRWLAIIVRQVIYIRYLLACQKLQRSTPYNIVKMSLPEVGFSAVAILGGGWLQSSTSSVTRLRWLTVTRAPRVNAGRGPEMSLHTTDWSRLPESRVVIRCIRIRIAKVIETIQKAN